MIAFSAENKKWFILLALAGLVAVALLSLSFFSPEPATILKRGRLDFDRGRYARARQKFQKVLSISGKSSGARCEAKLFYATALLRQNRYQEAAAEFREFIKEYPNSFWTSQAYFDLAYCQKLLGNQEKAYGIYQEIITKFPSTTWAQYAKDRLKEFKDLNK